MGYSGDGQHRKQAGSLRERLGQGQHFSALMLLNIGPKLHPREMQDW